MFWEIGSEFHAAEIGRGSGMIYPCSGMLVFSGRGAIDTVIRNLEIKKIIMPSYCCESMIEPFLSRGITVLFFDVAYHNGLGVHLDIPDDADALLWCNYFGFHVSMPDLSDFVSRGGIVIEDITHSLLSSSQYNSQSHYLIASVRKWEPLICGGYFAAVNGKQLRFSAKQPPEEFVEQKQTAMRLKQEYLRGGDETKKAEYMRLFAECNHWLGEHYHGLTMDAQSLAYLSHVDIELHRKQRIRNARALYEGLRHLPFVVPLFPLEEMDCPLFVPVVLEQADRDDLKKFLIENKIYCPVHWPRPQQNCQSNLYDRELSLICDQRYDETDMRRIITVLESWSMKRRRGI